jgi:hypothetical protein
MGGRGLIMGVDTQPVQIDKELERLRADVDTAHTLLEEVTGPYRYWASKHDTAQRNYLKADNALAEYERLHRLGEIMEGSNK